MQRRILWKTIKNNISLTTCCNIIISRIFVCPHYYKKVLKISMNFFLRFLKVHVCFFIRNMNHQYRFVQHHHRSQPLPGNLFFINIITIQITHNLLVSDITSVCNKYPNKPINISKCFWISLSVFGLCIYNFIIIPMFQAASHPINNLLTPRLAYVRWYRKMGLPASLVNIFILL